MALYKLPAGAAISLIIFLRAGAIFAEVSNPVQNNGGQAVTSEPTSSTKTNISEHSNSSNSQKEQSTVLPPDSHVDDSVATKSDKGDSGLVTQKPDDQKGSTKDTTQKKPKDTTTQNPNPDKDITQTSIKIIPSKVPHSVAQNTTNSQSLPHTDADFSKNNTQENTDEITTTQFVPVTFDTTWMDKFFSTRHYEGQYMFNGARYLFDFVVRNKHPNDPSTLVTSFYDADGAVLEFNGTSQDGRLIVFTLARIYTPGVRFPLKEALEVTGSFPNADQPYFTANFTKPINSSFSWLHMNKGLGAIETGETAGTRTAIVIIIPTSIAFLGICGTIAIICWASKKGYLRGRHKSYRLFTNAQVSYESEAETIHI